MKPPVVMDDPLFPEAARSLFVRLYGQPTVSRKVIAQRIDLQLEKIRKAAGDNVLIDLKVCERVAESLKALLEHGDAHTPREHKLLIQAAARYFLMEEDAQDDLSSFVGFDDDAGVVNAVARYLGRTDLIVEVL